MSRAKRWFLGVQSRKDAAVIMIEVCRTVQALGCEWIQENDYCVRCRQLEKEGTEVVTEMRLQLY